MPIEYMFGFICNEQCIKVISSSKMCGLFSSVLWGTGELRQYWQNQFML